MAFGLSVANGALAKVVEELDGVSRMKRLPPRLRLSSTQKQR
jgi:hypothetical protein